MQQRNFTIFNGKNGASYILNTKSWSALAFSLEFYKARSLKQRVLKLLLHVTLFLLSFVNRLVGFSRFKSVEDINQYIYALGCSSDLLIDESCSVLISPTRDKIIVNHHNQYFHKFAFSGSYENVRREAEIYRFIAQRSEHFSISRVLDFVDDGGAVCSFKMQPPVYVKRNDLYSKELVLPLLEFFNFSAGGKIGALTLISQLSAGFNNVIPDKRAITASVFEKLKSYGHFELKLGLVHGDFKPWNIIAGSPVVFFDFEEATLDGLPLEDLFNYIIDPDIRYIPVEDIAGLVFSTVNTQAYEDYLQRLECGLSYSVLLYLYLLGRIQFWAEQGQVDVADRYLALLQFIDNSENALNG